MDRRRRDPAWVDERAERRSRRIAYYLTYTDDEHDRDGEVPDWVVRAERPPSLVLPWICAPCNDWTDEGSDALGACTRCGTARPGVN